MATLSTNREVKIVEEKQKKIDIRLHLVELAELARLA